MTDGDFSFLIHIGAGKCGSSALQAFLRENREELIANGVFVPDKALQLSGDIEGHQLWFFQGMLPVDDDKVKIVDSRMDQLAKYCIAHGYKLAVISAENLCNPYGCEALFKGTFDKYLCRFLFYIRRQDDYLNSAWQQWYIKQGYSLCDWLVMNVGLIANWFSYIQPWVSAYGVDSIVVRKYSSKSLVNADIVQDFLQLISEDFSKYRAPGIRNISLDSRVCSMLSRTNLFKDMHDNNIYSTLAQLAPNTLIRNKKKRSVFTLSTRQAIMNRYAQSNDSLRSLFFPNDKELFEAPNDEICPTQEELHEFSSQLIFEMIDNLYKLVQKGGAK